MGKATFIHTADWQIGKPFAQIADPDKRAIARRARIEAIERIGEAVRRVGASFVVVAGDLFDAPTVDRATVSAACSAIGRISAPVFVLPGNHDHAGPASVWRQDFFVREQEQLAPNMRVLDRPEPVVLDEAVLLPCPLQRRNPVEDPTAWLFAEGIWDALPDDVPRVVVAHGAAWDFGADADGDSGSERPVAVEKIESLPVDYVALGDWHGTLSVGTRSWYAGTPEPDRFPKGGTYDPGNVLAVCAGREEPPRVDKVATGRLCWVRRAVTLAGDDAVARLADGLQEALAGKETESLVHLEVSGVVNLAQYQAFETLCATWESRLLRLELASSVHVVPNEEEIASLARRAEDPLISAVADDLVRRVQAESDAQVAQRALWLLYDACVRQEVRR